MILSIQNYRASYLEVDAYKFLRLGKFKYFGVIMNGSVNSHEKVKKKK